MGAKSILADTLRSIHKELYAQAKALADSKSTSSSEFADTFMDVQAGYASLFREARRASPQLYAELSQGYEEAMARLRVRAGAAAFKQAHQITSLMAILYTPLDNSSFGSPLMPVYAPASRQIGQIEGTAPLDELAESKEAPDYSGLGIEKSLLKKITPLVGQYVPMSKIVSISGYTEATFYSRLRKGNVPKGERGQYLINESTIPILFGKAGKGQKGGRKTGTKEPEGVWMSISQIGEKFGYKSEQVLHKRVQEYGAQIPSRKEGNMALYLVTKENSGIFERKRAPKGSKSPNPNPGEGTITFKQMSSMVQEKFGDATEEMIGTFLAEHHKEMDRGHNKFSREVLERLIEEACKSKT